MQTRTFFGELVGERALESTELEAWLANSSRVLLSVLGKQLTGFCLDTVIRVDWNEAK